MTLHDVLELLIILLIIGLVIWAIQWFVSLLALPAHIKQITMVIVAVIGLIWLLTVFVPQLHLQ